MRANNIRAKKRRSGNGRVRIDPSISKMLCCALALTMVIGFSPGKILAFGDDEGAPSSAEQPASEAAVAEAEDSPAIIFEAGSAYGFAEAGITAVSDGLMGIVPLGIGDRWDLSNYVTGIMVKDSTGKVITTGDYFYDETYSFNISFSEHDKTGGQFQYNGGKLIYQLPDELVVTSPKSGYIKVANGSNIGEYSIDSSGRVEVRFYDVDNNGNPISQNFIDYYANVKFTLALDADFDEDVTAGKIDFGASTSITVNTIEKQPAGLKIDKAASAFDSATESVSFTVDVTAVGGKVDNVILTDALNFSIQSAFRIKQSDIPGNYANPFSSGSGSFEYSINGGSWMPQSGASWASGGQSLRFDFGTPGGITLQKNESVKLRYTLKLGDILDYFASQGGSSRWIQRLLYNLTLTNTATATGSDGSSDVSATAMTQTPMRKSFLAKAGVQQADGQIQWTAKVGDGTKALNGLTITDSMSSGLSQPVTGDVTIKLYGLSNNLLSTVVVTPPYTGTAGFALTGTTGFTYTVPTSPANIGYADLTYSTTPSITDPSSIYRNEIGITVGGETSSVSGSVSYSGVGTGVGTPENAYNIRWTKTSEWVFGATGKPTDIVYTIVMRVPAGTDTIDSAAGVFQDIFMTYVSSDGNYPWPSRDWNITGGAETDIDNLVSVAISGETDPDYFIHLPADGSGEDMRVYLGVTGEPVPVSSYRWPYSDAKTVTITYRIPLDIPDLDATTTLLEYLESTPDARIKNQIVSTGNEVEDVVVASCYDYYPLYKSVEPNYFMSSLFDYTVVLNGNTNVGQENPFDSPFGNLGYQLFAPGEPAIFSDTFDPKLRYVPGSLKVSDGTNFYGPYALNGGGYITDWLEGMIVGNTLTVDFRDLAQVDGALNMIIDLTPGDWYSDNKVYTVYYQLLLRDEYTESYPDPADPPLSVKNTATVYPTGEHFDGGVFSDDAEALYTPKVITKEMTAENGENTAEVEIIINPDGKRLRYASVEDPVLTATDVMEGPLGYFLSTIKIQTKNKIGSVWVDPWVDAPAPTGTGALWSFTPVDDKTLEFKLPDEQPIRITYTVAITSGTGIVDTASNKITILGHSGSDSLENYIVTKTSAFADAARTEFLLYKNDSQQEGQLLTGARFALYILRDAGWGDGRTPTDSGIAATIPITGGTLFYLQDEVVGPSGYIRFDDPWLTQSYDCIYALVEIEAPNGYLLPASLEDRTTYFAYTDKSGMSSLVVNVVLDNMMLSNDAITPIDVSIPIEKRVFGVTATTETFTFRLAQVTDATGDTLASPFIGAVETISGAGTTAFTIENLGIGSYFFKITEDNDGVSGWIYDSTAYIVEVEVFINTSDGESLDYTVTVLNAGSTEIVFANTDTNTYASDLGGLEITKALSAVRPASITTSTPFDVKVKDVTTNEYLIFDASGDYIGKDMTGSTLQVSVASSLVLTGIPAGLILKVEEVASSGEVSGWAKVASYSLGEVTIAKDVVGEVAITNAYVQDREYPEEDITDPDKRSSVLPQTGDTSSKLVWVMLAFTSASALFFLADAMRKYSKRRLKKGSSAE